MNIQKYSEYFFVLFVGVFSVFLVTINIIKGLDTQIAYNNADPVLNMLFLKWGADNILGRVVEGTSLFGIPYAFPFERALAFSDNLFGNQIVFLPLYVLSNYDPQIAFSLWIITIYFLNYFLMYLFLKKSIIFSCDVKYVHIVGALVFAFSLPLISLLGAHFQLLPLFAIPITLYFLERSVITLKLIYFIFFGLSISFQFYLGVQTGFFLIVLLLLMLPFYLKFYTTQKNDFFKKILVSGLVFIIPTILLMWNYLDVSSLTGHRTYEEVKYYIPSLKHFFTTNEGERSIFIGIPSFLILVVSIFFYFKLKTEKKKEKFLLILIGLSFMFFLKDFNIFYLFFNYVPGFDSIRTPGRFIYVSITLIAIFSTLLISKIDVKLRYIFLSLFVVGIWINGYLYKISTMTWQYEHNNLNEKIEKHINGKPTIILPLYDDSIAGILGKIDRMKMVNQEFQIFDIYSGFIPQFINEISKQYAKMDTLNDMDSFLNRIIKLGFKRVLVQKDNMKSLEVLENIRSSDKLIMLYEDSTKLLFKIKEHYYIHNYSLNQALKNNDWEFIVNDLEKTDEGMIFSGQFKGENLYGVVQKKEILEGIDVFYKNKQYKCDLFLNNIKDSYSNYKCIINKEKGEP